MAKDPSDIRRALSGCAAAHAPPPSSFEASLRFEPISGALRALESASTEHDALAGCLESGLVDTLKNVPFDPEEPEGALLRCTFEFTAELGHQCRRLGPNGQYVARRDGSE